MNITEVKNKDLDLHLKVTYNNDDLVNEIDTELTKIAKTANIKGFRVGKAPIPLLRKRYNDSIRYDIVGKKLQGAVKDLIDQRGLRPAKQPKVENLINEPGKDLEFTVEFELLPELSMEEINKTLKDITVEKPVLELDEKKDTKELMDNLLERMQEFTKETKAKAKKGDQVTLDATGFTDGKPFEKGNLDKTKYVIGSGGFLPDFEKALIGKKAGEEFEIKLTFPDDYHATELAGKEAKFEAKMIAVHQPVKPEINAEFLEKLGHKTEEDLKKSLLDSLVQGYEEGILDHMKLGLFDSLEKKLDVPVPQSMLDQELKALEVQKARLLHDDKDLKKKSEEEQQKYFEKLAKRRVSIGLFFAEYARHKNITLSNQEITDAVRRQAANFPGDPKVIFDAYNNNPQLLDMVSGPLLEKKSAQDIFASSVTVTEKKYKKDALEKLLDS